MQPSHPTKQSVHYQGFGFAKKTQNKSPVSPQPKTNISPQAQPKAQAPPQAYAQTYTRAQSPLGGQPNNQNNASQSVRNFPQSGQQNANYTQSQRNFGPNNMNRQGSHPQQGHPQQGHSQQMGNVGQQHLGMSQSMTPQQMRRSMGPSPNMMQQQQQQQQQQQHLRMQQQQQMRRSMPPQQNQSTPINKKDKNTKGKKKKKKKDKKGNPNQNNSLQPNRAPGHFASSSGGNVGMNMNRPQLKNSASAGPAVGPRGPQQQQQMRQPMSPNAANNQRPMSPNNQRPMSPNPNGRVQIQQNPNVKPGQLSPQQMQQMNAANMRQQQMLRQQQNGQQRQVKRNYPQGAWGPQQRNMMMQRRQMMMQNQRNNPHYQQWQQYYQRLMQNPQGQLQQMVMQQQQMIANLKRQLQERDKHYHKTIQTTINFKDMEINELRKQISKLDEENEAIGELQLQNFQMKKELNGLRGDHQSNVFDNLLSNINLAKSTGVTQVAWPGGVAPGPPPGGPKNSTTTSADKPDPKAALNAMMRAKASPSSMLLTKTKTEEEKKADNKDIGKFSKYAKMKKIGMPMVSIVNKMRMDGMSAEEIEEYTGERIGGDKEEAKPAGPKVNLADPKFSKYQRMKKLNMPLKSIVNKMRLDGCTQAEMDAMEGKEGGPSKPDRKKQKMNEMRQLAETMGLTPISESLPSKVAKLKRIHWELVEISALRKTFWWNINKDSSLPEHIDLGGKFELDFQVRQRKPRVQADKRSSKIHGGLDAINKMGKKSFRGKRDRICWIAAKRDQSIQIALKRIGLPNEVIYDAIADVDEDVLSLDVLEVIWEIVPSTDEAAFAEAKAEDLKDDVQLCGVSEMFHIEMSTIPEVKQQLSKWLFARTFREIYMDRLGQVNVMQKCANAIKHSVAFQTYLRIILSMGNLMNHGSVKGMAYGFKLVSVCKLLAGIKDYGGAKDLSMFLYQFAYNQFPQTRSLFEEMADLLKKAVRLEISTIETSIVKMADEFVAIDLFLRRLTDDFHPGDTDRFREYMTEFQEKQEADMMNLKVKIQNASSICGQVAKFYSVDLEDGKPEYLFILAKQFLDILDNAKRALLKLEKEKLKQQQRSAREAAKRRKTVNKGKMSVEERMKSKQRRILEEEDKGNLLFLDIKNAANAFADRQKHMASKLESTLLEKQALAQGRVSSSAQNDAIKRRVSAQVVEGGSAVGGLDMDEINRLRDMNMGPPGPGGDSLMPPMEMDALPPIDNTLPFQGMGMGMAPMDDGANMNPIHEELEDLNQDIDVAQPVMNAPIKELPPQIEQEPGQVVDLNTAQWDDDDF